MTLVNNFIVHKIQSELSMHIYICMCVCHNDVITNWHTIRCFLYHITVSSIVADHWTFGHWTFGSTAVAVVVQLPWRKDVLNYSSLPLSNEIWSII